MLTIRPRGTTDILPDQSGKWQYIENVAAEVCRTYGYREIRTPIFEHTELFIRGVGETTDIVEKEMYTFPDRAERSVTLRPEGTASVVRAFLENKLYAGPQPVKVYYLGPMFRYDKPQAGRYRQFHQFGIEVFGASHPAVDAEVMAMAMDFYHRLGLSDLDLHINSLGCPECRKIMREKLQQFFAPHISELCPYCQNRYTRNTLRILDCKSDRCRELAQDAPTTADFLCPDCRNHFEQVQQYMHVLQIPYIWDKHLVRGLDYYTHTAFEIISKDIGAQSSVGGGGRYNGLIEDCGGPSTPGIGFALGLERTMLIMEKLNKLPIAQSGLQVFIAALGNEALQKSFELLAKLRAAGISADMDYTGRSLKAQMKYAGKLDIPYVVIIGDDEIKKNSVILRNMAAGGQKEISTDELIEVLSQYYPERY